jgi:membrane protease YdiL (CAAX protease family)
VFALAHLPSMQWQWYALPDLALLAAALSWLRLRAGSLWPAVLAHGVNNLLAVVAWFATAGSA